MVSNLYAERTPLFAETLLLWGRICLGGIMAVFEYLRVSLGQPEQGSLLGSDGKVFRPISRREYLDRIFSRERWDFEYYGNNYSFLKEGVYGNILVARIGKEVIEVEHEGPDKYYAIRMHEKWHPAWMLFDLSKDSQLMAVQTNIASPKKLIRALFDRIEADAPNPEYYVFLEYVSQTSEFWRAVEEFKGRITRLEFTFIPPNALGLEEKIRTIVDIARDQSGAQQTRFTHVNKNGGLHPQGEYVEAALQATGEGAGAVSMKAGKMTIYSSSQNRKTKDVPNEEIPQQKDESAIKRLIKLLFG